MRPVCRPPAFVLEKADNEGGFEEALEEGFNASDKRAVFLRAVSSGSCRNLRGCDSTTHDDG